MICAGDYLYHGSYAAVERIDLTCCAPGKGFGKGFYLTSSHEQALRFVPSSLRKGQALGVVPRDQKHGFVSVFKVSDLGSLACFEFTEADGEWLRFVALNRRARLFEKLGEIIPAGLSDADIIVGKIANDTTNRVITTYLNGLYGEVGSKEAEDTAIRLLMPERLKDQYCFRTYAAVAALIPVKVERYDL